MTDFKIRKFNSQDTEAFIRVATSAFADEWIADGMTPDGFARQTRQIFRWRMIPYKLFTMLMGIQWEAFVAEVNGRAVGGAMYMGRKNRIVMANLMVEPAYRRQGIGQALLIQRLERLSERGVPFVTATVLETNQASLGNLRKQGFVEYYRKSTYQRSLPIPVEEKNEHFVVGRVLKASDRALFNQIEKKLMPPFVLYSMGAERTYFPSLLRKLYAQFLGSRDWTQAFDADGVTVGFLAADHQDPTTMGYISQPVIAPENMRYLPAMMHQAEAWMETIGLHSAKIEVPVQSSELISYLRDSGWNKEYTWIYLVKWLDEKAKQEFAFDG